ncbi:transient receptor potential cation channel subfamily A member 1-like [Oratosquilla oratoria]|uniref:transient receptor potential cation channel subfamily A member 1-like n=1 Tax=Oratosquilla oratoria TaxID=337810 RepID=UPI003F7586F4
MSTQAGQDPLASTVEDTVADGDGPVTSRGVGVTSHSWLPLPSFVHWRKLVRGSGKVGNPKRNRFALISDIKNRSEGEDKKELPKSTKMKPKLQDQVCLITQSPYRILKVAASGDLDELSRICADDRSRLHITDRKGWTPLHHASAKNQVHAAMFLINHGADINAQTKEGKSALHLCVENDAVEVLDCLINSGANTTLLDNTSKAVTHTVVINNKIKVLEMMEVHSDKFDWIQGDEQGRTPLNLAAQFDYDDCARILVDIHEACPKKPCNNGYYPIHMAAKNAAVRVLEVILLWAEKRGCERKNMISLPDLEGNSPLHLAVHGGEIKAVELCLRNGALISTQQNDESTPVHLACSQGALDIVKLMFHLQPEEKAKVLACLDAQKMTPLHCAAMFDHPELVAYLIKEGASVNLVDKEHRTPLLLAASQKGWRAVEVLLKHGADPSIRDTQDKNIFHVVIVNGGSITEILAHKSNTTLPCLLKLLNDQDVLGCSPMHYASKRGQIRSLDSLIQLGASVRTKNNRNESPLHFAAKYGRYNTIHKLIESVQGFLILNESDDEGKTALHIASEEGHNRVVTLLLSKGALLHRDYMGRTPLHLAAKGGHVDTITTLLSFHSHMLDQTDKDGNTPLHIAVCSNKADVVTQLLSLGCKLVENNAEFMPIDYAIQWKLSEAAVALVTHNRGPHEILQSASKKYGCVCTALITMQPKVYETVLNKAISKADVKQDSKEYYIKYSFYPHQMCALQIQSLRRKFNDPKWKPPPLFACNAMVNSGRVDLLMHPLTQKFLEMKWSAYGRYIHLVNLFIYLLFLSMVTIFAAGVLGINSPVVANFSRNHTDHQEEHHYDYGMACYVTAVGILFFSALGILKECFQIYHQRLKYLADGINLVEWMLYLTAMCMVSPVFLGSEYQAQQFNSAAVAVFTAWFTLLLYFQRFDTIGIYIVMFLEILNTLLKVLAVFSILIVAFGLSFYILLSHGNHLAFSTVPMSMVRTFSMMLGEIDFLNTYVYPLHNASNRNDVELLFPKTTFGILLVFMILMPILLMNLLIGLAVGDIESVRKNAQLKRLAMQVDLHTGLENKLPTMLIARVNKNDFLLYPNESACYKSTFLYKILSALSFCSPFSEKVKIDMEGVEGNYDDLMWDEIELQHRRLREMSGQLDQQTKLLRLIMQVGVPLHFSRFSLYVLTVFSRDLTAEKILEMSSNADKLEGGGKIAQYDNALSAAFSSNVEALVK